MFIKKHASQHALKITKSLISFKKTLLYTKSDFALSTTTILFLKKKISRQYNYAFKNKNLVTLESQFAWPDQVRFGLFCFGIKPNFSSMPVQPTGQSSTQSSVSFEVKSAQLPLVALMLKSNDLVVVANDFCRLYGESGERTGFFDQDPVVLDFSSLKRDAEWSEIEALLKGMRTCNLIPFAFRGEPVNWTEALLQVGLIQVPLEISKVRKTIEKVSEPVPEVVREVPGPATMVIDKPIRSGQKIYARGADLVVLAMVNQGAEVVADGNIHVYAPLRGKAMAGARGNLNARIFSLCMEPELISIAGIYRTSETPLPANIAGKPAQVRLSSEDGQDKLLIEPLRN